MSDTIDSKAKDLWERAKSVYISTLQSTEEKQQIERNFSMISSVANNGNTFIVYTNNQFAAELFQDKYAEKIRMSLMLADSSQPWKLKFIYDETVKPTLIVPDVLRSAPTVRRSERVSSFISTLPLNEEFTFDQFVRGPTNSWAYAAAEGVVNKPGQPGCNPLFIHGGTGLGKTHLMHAIGNELKKRNPMLAICYLTAETFLNEYVNHLKAGNLMDFRNKYRAVDVLLVDDVQFLQKGQQCQEEFFNTFNELLGHQKQIVMTCDVAPRNLPQLEDRLISRFVGGMVQEIESPTYEMRMAILQKKAENLVPRPSENTLKFIAEKITSHVRAIEGALAKVKIFMCAEPTVQLTNETLAYLLKDYIEKEKTVVNLSIETIQNAVEQHYSVTHEMILSMDRTQSIVTPRQMAMYISRKLTNCSLPEIARQFDKSHATILHGVKNIQKRLDVEPELKSKLEEIIGAFGYKLSDLEK